MSVNSCSSESWEPGFKFGKLLPHCKVHKQQKWFPWGHSSCSHEELSVLLSWTRWRKWYPKKCHFWSSIVYLVSSYMNRYLWVEDSLQKPPSWPFFTSCLCYLISSFATNFVSFCPNYKWLWLSIKHLEKSHSCAETKIRIWVTAATTQGPNH